MRTLFFLLLGLALTNVSSRAEDTNLAAVRVVDRPLAAVKQAVLSYGTNTGKNGGYFLLLVKDVPEVSYETTLLDCRYELIRGKLLFNGDILATSVSSNATRLQISVPVLVPPTDPAERKRIDKHLSKMADEILAVLKENNGF